MSLCFIISTVYNLLGIEDYFGDFFMPSCGALCPHTLHVLYCLGTCPLESLHSVQSVNFIRRSKHSTSPYRNLLCGEGLGIGRAWTSDFYLDTLCDIGPVLTPGSCSGAIGGRKHTVASYIMAWRGTEFTNSKHESLGCYLKAQKAREEPPSNCLKNLRRRACSRKKLSAQITIAEPWTCGVRDVVPVQWKICV